MEPMRRAIAMASNAASSGRPEGAEFAARALKGIWHEALAAAQLPRAPVPREWTEVDWWNSNNTMYAMSAEEWFPTLLKEAVDTAAHEAARSAGALPAREEAATGGLRAQAPARAGARGANAEPSYDGLPDAATELRQPRADTGGWAPPASASGGSRARPGTSSRAAPRLPESEEEELDQEDEEAAPASKKRRTLASLADDGLEAGAREWAAAARTVAWSRGACSNSPAGLRARRPAAHAWPPLRPPRPGCAGPSGGLGECRASKDRKALVTKAVAASKEAALNNMGLHASRDYQIVKEVEAVVKTLVGTAIRKAPPCPACPTRRRVPSPARRRDARNPLAATLQRHTANRHVPSSPPNDSGRAAAPPCPAARPAMRRTQARWQTRTWTLSWPPWTRRSGTHSARRWRRVARRPRAAAPARGSRPATRSWSCSWRSCRRPHQPRPPR
jgi:hypothetical protein